MGKLDFIRAKSSRKKQEKAYNKLYEYVDSELDSGKTAEEVRKSLLKVGWDPDLVEKTLSARESKVIIKLDEVSKKFGGNKIFNKVSLDIMEGELFGIIGLSGSGKTTLLNTIVGYVQADEGSVLFKVPKSSKLMSMEEDEQEIKKRFGFAPQEHSFYSKLTTSENIDHFGALYGMGSRIIKTNAKLLLESMELQDAKNTLAENLSGGMQRRLGIACSLIHHPKILILDEPTSDLDPFLRQEIWNLIKKINKQGTTVLLTSHFLAEVEHLCGRIAVLHEGEIKHMGSVDSLRDEYSPNEEVHLELASKNYGDLVHDIRKKHNISHVTHEDGKVIMCAPDAEALLHDVLHIVEKRKEKIVDVSVNKPTLREVFVSIVKKKR